MIKLPNKNDKKLNFNTYQSISESIKKQISFIEQIDRSDPRVFKFAMITYKMINDTYCAIECQWDKENKIWIHDTISESYGFVSWGMNFDNIDYDPLIPCNLSDNFAEGTVVLAVPYPGNMNKWIIVASADNENTDVNRPKQAEITSHLTIPGFPTIYYLNIYGDGLDQPPTEVKTSKVTLPTYSHTIPDGTFTTYIPSDDESSSSESSESSED